MVFKGSIYYTSLYKKFNLFLPMKKQGIWPLGAVWTYHRPMKLSTTSLTLSLSFN